MRARAPRVQPVSASPCRRLRGVPASARDQGHLVAFPRQFFRRPADAASARDQRYGMFDMTNLRVGNLCNLNLIWSQRKVSPFWGGPSVLQFRREWLLPFLPCLQRLSTQSTQHSFLQVSSLFAFRRNELPLRGLPTSTVKCFGEGREGEKEPFPKDLPDSSPPYNTNSDSSMICWRSRRSAVRNRGGGPDQPGRCCRSVPSLFFMV